MLGVFRVQRMLSGIFYPMHGERYFLPRLVEREARMHHVNPHMHRVEKTPVRALGGTVSLH